MLSHLSLVLSTSLFSTLHHKDLIPAVTKTTGTVQKGEKADLFENQCSVLRFGAFFLKWQLQETIYTGWAQWLFITMSV